MNNHDKDRSLGICTYQLSIPIELSEEKIQDFQAAFSIMDSKSKGFVGPEDINQVAQAAGTHESYLKNFISTF